jgi:hypothetical protein
VLETWNFLRNYIYIFLKKLERIELDINHIWDMQQWQITCTYTQQFKFSDICVHLLPCLCYMGLRLDLNFVGHRDTRSSADDECFKILKTSTRLDMFSKKVFKLHGWYLKMAIGLYAYSQSQIEPRSVIRIQYLLTPIFTRPEILLVHVLFIRRTYPVPLAPALCWV